MLNRIHIRDFAIIEALELELRPGMTALTGETGAGKSILVDALGLLLGDRAGSHTVRQSASRAELAATLDLSKEPEANAWLAEHDLAAEGEVILRRVVTAEGRSRAYINGTPVAVTALRELGETLVDIHGQHAHQSLLQRDMQRRLLDHHGNLLEQVSRLGCLQRSWDRLSARIRALSTDRDEKQARRALLRYQVDELAALDPRPEEVEELDAELQRLNHGAELKRAGYEAYHRLYESEEGSLHTQLGSVISTVAAAAQVDPRLSGIADMLSSAQLELDEAASELRDYSESVEVSPERMGWVEERLASLHQMSRKHGVSPSELAPHLAQLGHELAGLPDPDEDLGTLGEELGDIETAYRTLALTVREHRIEAARDLSAEVTRTMQTLGMEGGRFHIDVRPESRPDPGPSGLDVVEFLVAANPGQEPRALGRVASGGELSRISLAIQVIAAASTPVPTLIFDEVDTGIGGAVAEVVGRQLRELGRSRQVLCVTHLPQVAAQAHHHFRVSKSRSGSGTRTGIVPLEDGQRVEEIARMLGGVRLTEQTRAHAAEMISQAPDP